MKPRKAAVVFIFITVTLDMLALGLIAPVLPKLVVDFLGGDAPNAAKMFGIFGTVFALMQFMATRIPRLPAHSVSGAAVQTAEGPFVAGR